METRYTKQCSDEMYETLQHKLFSTTVTDLPHHVLLSQNLLKDIDADSMHQVYKPHSFKISQPKPISSVCSNLKPDSCLQLVDEKNKWKLLVGKRRSLYQRLPQNEKLHSIKKCHKTIIPLYLLNFTKLLREDPDPYFDCHYDWYYTGDGNLCSIIIEDIPYVIQSVDETLYIKKYHSNYDHKVECKYSIINKCPIYETICFSLSNGKTTIGLRQKFRIYLLDLMKSDNEMKLELIKTVKSDIPFTSFDVDTLLNKIYCCCVDGSIHVFDMESENYTKLSNRNSKEKAVNLRSCIKVFNDNSLLCTTSESICILDKRECKLVNELSSFPKMNCEQFQISKIGTVNKNKIYVGTTHHILKYDMRYIADKNDLENQWTHGMEYPPIYLITTTMDDEELIHASCQSSGGSCLIVNACNSSASAEFKDQRLVFPYKPPSVLESLRKLQLQGHFLDPMLGMKPRVNMSRSGSTFIIHDKAMHLLQLNCIGDIFSHTFYDEEFDSSEDVRRGFQLWSEQLSLQNENFQASSVADMTVYQENMKRKVNFKVPTAKQSKHLLNSKPYWINCIKDLNECTDMCAQEILSVWELDKNDIEAENAPANTNFKITAWMEAND